MYMLKLYLQYTLYIDRIKVKLKVIGESAKKEAPKGFFFCVSLRGDDLRGRAVIILARSIDYKSPYVFTLFGCFFF